MSKSGFSYHQVDTDRFQDIKIKRLKKKFKGEGFAIYEFILNEIYREKGCYLDWNDDVIFDIAEYWLIDEDRVVEIVKYCCSIELFNEQKFTKNKVVTSKSIQERFINMSIKAKRIGFFIPKEVIIIQEDSIKLLEETHELTEESPTNSVTFEQSKEKKSKEKKSKVIIPPELDIEKFISKWDILLSQKKWKSKPESAIIQSLEKLSKYDVDFATTLVENAISGEYQGVVYPDTDEKYRKFKSATNKQLVTIN